MPNDITTPPDVLARICADTLAEVARRKAERGIDRLRADIAARADAPRGFGRALKRAVAAGPLWAGGGDQEGLAVRRR